MQKQPCRVSEVWAGGSGGISDHVRAWHLQGGLGSAWAWSCTLAGQEERAQKLGVVTYRMDSGC